MREPINFEIDDKKYMTSLYPATKGLKILTKLAKYAGAPLGMLAMLSGSEEKMNEEVSPNIISEMIQSVMNQLDEDIVIGLVNDILHTTKVISGNEHRTIQFDLDFAGEFSHLFKVLKAILSFQYADFFGELAGATQGLRRAEVNNSKKQKIVAR